jgi:poly(3-hydroxybutyrate) depolymerase
MNYQMYQAQADFMDPLRFMARTAGRLLRTVTPKEPYGLTLRHVDAALEVFGYSGVTHQRPEFNINDIRQPGSF